MPTLKMGSTTVLTDTTLANAVQDNLTRLGTVTTGTFEGTLNSDTTFSGDAGQRTAKAWAYFDGTGTPSFHDSYNCSTITDGGTGIYSINYTNNLGSADYAAVASAGSAEEGPLGFATEFAITNVDGGSTVALCEVLVINCPYFILQDGENISLTVFGD